MKHHAATTSDHAFALPTPLWRGDLGQEALRCGDSDPVEWYIPGLNGSHAQYLDNRWIRNGSFHYAFYPFNVDISKDHVLGCLFRGFQLSNNSRYYPQLVPTVTRERARNYSITTYSLPERILNQWWDLECNLRETARLLGPIRAEEFAEFQYLNGFDLGYSSPYAWGSESKGTAAYQVWSGRNHILALACWVTALIAFHHHNAMWESRLKTMSVHWVEGLKMSRFFTDFSGQTKRVGGHINMTAKMDFMANPAVIRSLFNGKVPVSLFFQYDRINSIPQYREERRYIQSLDIERPVATQLLHPNIDVALFYVANSGQVRGQTVFQFMAKRDKEDQKELQKETPVKTGWRGAAERKKIDKHGNWRYYYDSHEEPPKVWYWKKVPFPPFHFRRAVNPDKIPQMFSLFNPKQIRYHYWSNQYDLCHEFNLNGPTYPSSTPLIAGNAPAGDEVLESLSSAPAFDPQIHFDEATAYDSRHGPVTQMTTHINKSLLNTPQEMHSIGYDFTTDIETRLRERYGFGDHEDPNLVPPVDPEQLSRCLAILGESGSINLLSLQTQYQVYFFVKALIQRFDHGIPLLSDLLPRNISDLGISCQGLMHSIADTHPHHLVFLQPLSVRWTIPSFGITNEPQPFYLLTEHTQGTVIFGLPSPTSWKQVWRSEWGPDAKSVSKELVSRGIPFVAIWDTAQPVAPINPVNELSPRVRSPTYSYTITDYRAYIEARTSLLRNTSILAACLRHGGILWRLAMEFVYSPDYEHDTPPNCVDNDDGHLISHPFTLDRRNRHGIATTPWVTTHLTQAEIHIICGVYVNPTCKSVLSPVRRTLLIMVITDIANQFTFLSWWPLPSVWEGCGMNVHYWTAGCEEWFADHVSRICSGAAGPTRSDEWKDDLRRDKAKLARILSFIERDIPATI